MPHIRKDKAGSCPGYTWEHDGDVVEIDDPYLVGELLAIPGFSEVAAPAKAEKPEKSEKADAGPDAEGDEPAAPKRGRPRKTTQSQTEISE
jgi:hypothetical protein